MTMDEGIEEFLSELEARGRSPRTLSHYRTHLRRFQRWLERSSGDRSLDLDPRSLQVKIRFRKSSSPHFKEALGIAQELPGYRALEGATYEVKVPAALEDPELWERLRQLADWVGHWKRSEVALEGAPVESFWEFEDSLREVRECFSRRGDGALADGYCSGKDGPDDDARSFGCRLLRGVNCEVRGNSLSHSRWYQFGKLSSDLSTFTVDKDAILRTVESSTARQAATICPAFSWERVREAINELPSSIELGDSSPYELKYSEIDPSKPLGIRLK